ncbi:hypothetical protein CDAR_407651 [Caerostris darwini]|uniref:Uncharacterized protein n=1 Tax=Caerostris darwini TaxID=1538125 RepID=A0AAV4Q0Z9_9ARAC|nr:hypothetical protein CDAR_407651 [Caerostris darwini]
MAAKRVNLSEPDNHRLMQGGGRKRGFKVKRRERHKSRGLTGRGEGPTAWNSSSQGCNYVSYKSIKTHGEGRLESYAVIIMRSSIKWR